MSVTIQIPTPLRRFTAEQGEVSVDGQTVAEALADLTRLHPALSRHLYADDGRLRSFVNIFLNEEDVRFLERGDTKIAPGDVLTIIPSIAGGAGEDGAQVSERQRVSEHRPQPPRPAIEDPAAPAKVGRAEPLPDLSPEEIRRYSRHLILPEVGRDGQRALKGAKVLLVGAGGLGSPLGLYLAAAGVGTLGLVDFDVVDETNLQRQVLYGRSDVGRKKLAAAADRLGEINPHVELAPHEVRLTSDNALELLAPYDLVVDGTDNFQTRYLVNDACVLLGKPNVYGSIFRFEGQVSVFWGARGPCYRCLFPEPPPPGLVPSCAEGGVLGVLPGIIGCLQANEVLKLILGVGDPLIGRLLLFDALKMRFREFRLKKDPACPICSEHPTQHGLIDYDQFCGVPSSPEPLPEGFDISVTDLKGLIDKGYPFTLLDVRSDLEFDIARIPGSTLIPLPDLAERTEELPRDLLIVAHCHHGGRSTKAVQLLRSLGFDNTRNLAGGIDAWSEEIDPSVARY